MEVAIRLNIDPRKADQALRGLAVLPHGIGKKMRIAVFADGPAADAALKVKPSCLASGFALDCYPCMRDERGDNKWRDIAGGC